MRRFAFRLAAAIIAAATPTAVFAQDAVAPSSGQPLVIERIPDSLVVAPEYKVTGIDKEVGQLAGLHAGRLIDDTLFVGGAVYWLTNGSSDLRLGYGGVMIGWSAPAGSRIRFGARGMAGVGTATRGTDISLLRGETLARFGRPATPVPATFPSQTVRVRVRDEFAFVEPEGTVLLRLNEHVGVDVSAGYRFTALEDALRDRLDGATGSVGLQVSW